MPPGLIDIKPVVLSLDRKTLAMLPLLALHTGANERDDDDLASLTADLNSAAKNAANKAKKFVQRRKSVPQAPVPPTRPPQPPSEPPMRQPVDPMPPDEFDYDSSSDEDVDNDRTQYESGDELDDLDASEAPQIPVDIDIDLEILEDTVHAMERIIRGEVSRREMMQLLLSVRRNVVDLWNSVVDCYRKNQQMEQQRNAMGAQDASQPKVYTVERVKTPRSMQKIIALIAAMMAVLSIAGPVLLTSAVTTPDGNTSGGGNVFNVRKPASLPPGRTPLPALPPPTDPQSLVKKQNAVRRAGARDPRPPLNVRGRQTAPPPPPQPKTPSPSAPPPIPLAPLLPDDYDDDIDPNYDQMPSDPGWWRDYLQRALLAGGVGLLGMAKESANRRM